MLRIIKTLSFYIFTIVFVVLVALIMPSTIKYQNKNIKNSKTMKNRCDECGSTLADTIVNLKEGEQIIISQTTDTETNYLLQGKNGERLKESIEQVRDTEKLLSEAREEAYKHRDNVLRIEVNAFIEGARFIINKLNERKTK